MSTNPVSPDDSPTLFGPFLRVGIRGSQILQDLLSQILWGVFQPNPMGAFEPKGIGAFLIDNQSFRPIDTRYFASNLTKIQ
jgi:hypothetical protein